MALSLSLLIGSITILATTLFQGRAMAPSMLCKPFLPIVRQLSYYGAVQYGAVSDRLVSPPPVQSLGLPEPDRAWTGPARSCRRVPPADERYIYRRSSDRCLSLLQHCAFVVPPLVSRAVFPHVDEQVVANGLSTRKRNRGQFFFFCLCFF